jgi:hypothetical protein
MGWKRLLAYIHLWEVRAMILAVPKLEQSLFGDRPVTAGGGAIQAYALGLQVVYAQQLLVQCPLKGAPACIVTQGRQHP